MADDRRADVQLEPSPLTFHSILFPRPEQRVDVDQRDAPAFFRDLNLGPVIESITKGRDEYRLTPFFYAQLTDIDSIIFRQEILRDLEDPDVWARIATFAQNMRAMREQLTQAGKLYYQYQKESWFLDAVATYGEAVADLRDGLSRAALTSRGLRAFREYLCDYVASPGFTALRAETATLRATLAGITYYLHIHGNRITVRRYNAEPDYAAAVDETFEKFKRGAVKDYRVTFPDGSEMNHIEAAVLDRVALFYPDVFSALDDYCRRRRHYLDQKVTEFDREAQFYVAYLEYVRHLAAAGLGFCYPTVVDDCKEVSAADTFDIALANKLVREHSPVVCNDFHLANPERIFVVTGPNQGGKTTFARTLGQLHYLASIGCVVPGRAAQLFLFDHIFTHFEREENLSTLRGKLEDDLVRIHDILTRATPRSIVIMNEIFTSTTFRDALFLSHQVLGRIVDLDLLCVCVTFIDELTLLSPTIVSMVSTVRAEDPTLRTYKVLRRPADGRAYAAAITEKYGSATSYRIVCSRGVMCALSTVGSRGGIWRQLAAMGGPHGQRPSRTV